MLETTCSPRDVLSLQTTLFLFQQSFSLPAAFRTAHTLFLQLVPLPDAGWILQDAPAAQDLGDQLRGS